ncbi:hypothetical protein BJ741DRAFT_621529, partial [Chytriomyces cf. hyalinus JEL632]
MTFCLLLLRLTRCLFLREGYAGRVVPARANKSGECFIIWYHFLRTCCIKHACHSTDGIAEGKKVGKTGDRGM